MPPGLAILPIASALKPALENYIHWGLPLAWGTSLLFSFAASSMLVGRCKRPSGCHLEHWWSLPRYQRIPTLTLDNLMFSDFQRPSTVATTEEHGHLWGPRMDLKSHLSMILKNNSTSCDFWTINHGISRKKISVEFYLFQTIYRDTKEM